MGDEEGGEKGTGGGFREAESCIARNGGRGKIKRKRERERERGRREDGWTELRLLGMNSRRGLSGREIDFHGWGLAVRTLWQLYAPCSI